MEAPVSTMLALMQLEAQWVGLLLDVAAIVVAVLLSRR